jgi:hypothetical protein
MTAKEKAKQLYNKFYEASDGMGIAKYQSKVELAKKSSIIAADEIIESNTNVTGHTMNLDYWQEVKNELNQF